MANPNTTAGSQVAVYNDNAGMAVTTVETMLVENSAASGELLRITTLRINNVDGVNNAEITAKHYLGATPINICGVSHVVPKQASLDLADGDNPIYLKEGDSIKLTANADGDLDAICYFQRISESA